MQPLLVSLCDSREVQVNFSCRREALNIDACTLRRLPVHLPARGHAVFSHVALLLQGFRPCLACTDACSR